MRKRPFFYVARLFYRSQALRFLTLSALSVLGAISSAVSLVLLQRLVDGTNAGGMRLVLTAAAYIGVALLLPNAFGILQSLLREQIQRRTQQDVTSRLLKQSTSVSLDRLETPDHQTLLSMLSKADSGLLMQFVLSYQEIIVAFIRLLSVASVLFSFYWALPLLLVLAVVPEFITNSIFAKMRHKLFLDQSVAERRIGYLGDLLTDREAVREIRSYRVQDSLFRDWKRRKEAYDQVQFQFDKRRQTFVGVSQLVLLSAMILTLFLIVKWVLDGKTTAGAFISAIFAVNYIMQSIYQLIQNINSIQNNRHRVTQLIEYVEDQVLEEEDEEDATLPAVPPQFEIAFDRVAYRYPGTERDVLQEVSFTIQNGERIALVGANGSGKSTLIRLLLGLTKPTSGRILLDGRPLEQYSLRSYRERLTVVFQDFARYHLTVEENIALGYLPALSDRSAVEQAAEQSGADAFVARLGRGYEQPLGVEFEEGVDLSGGQWQKLAIARGYIRPADCLVMDEPTAALDPVAEVELYRQFAELAADRTAILVSHRMGSATLADRILVLQEGRLREVGTHLELMARQGEYHKLFTAQAEWYQEVASAVEGEVQG